MRIAHLLSLLLLVAFTTPIRANKRFQPYQLPFSAPVSCDEFLNDESNFGFVSRKTGPELDLKVVGQLIMDQYPVINLDEKSVLSNLQSAVAMASTASDDENQYDHQEEKLGEDVYRRVQKDLLNDIGVKLPKHPLGGFEKDSNPFSVLEEILQVGGIIVDGDLRNGHLRSSETSTTEKAGTMNFYIDKRHFQELFEHKRKWENTPIFAVVDCRADHQPAHTRNYRRRHEYYRKQERTFESHFAFYTMFAVITVFFISRLKLRIDLKVDIGGEVSERRNSTKKSVDNDTAATILDATVINDLEPQAVRVY